MAKRISLGFPFKWPPTQGELLNEEEEIDQTVRWLLDQKVPGSRVNVTTAYDPETNELVEVQVKFAAPASQLAREVARELESKMRRTQASILKRLAERQPVQLPLTEALVEATEASVVDPATETTGPDGG